MPNLQHTHFCGGCGNPAIVGSIQPGSLHLWASRQTTSGQRTAVVCKDGARLLPFCRSCQPNLWNRLQHAARHNGSLFGDGVRHTPAALQVAFCDDLIDHLKGMLTQKGCEVCKLGFFSMELRPSTSASRLKNIPPGTKACNYCQSSSQQVSRVCVWCREAPVPMTSVLAKPMCKKCRGISACSCNGCVGSGNDPSRAFWMQASAQERAGLPITVQFR
jgi:hypothetical protein